MFPIQNRLFGIQSNMNENGTYHIESFEFTFEMIEDV